MSHRLRNGVAALAATLCLSILPTAAQAKTLDVVIAGDSYASGVGAGNYTGGTCFRSPGAFGELYAQRVRETGTTVNVTNAACGGAVVADLDKQLDAITPQTDLVVLTIGGNDVGFANIVIQCFLPVISDPNRCRSTIANAKTKVPSVREGALQKLDLLRQRARQGVKVAVVSYPYLANDSKFMLRSFFSATDAGTAVRELGDLGDQAIASARDQANTRAGYDLVTLAPTKDLFVGHEPNQNPYVENPNRWIHEITQLNGPVDFYHPNRAGHAAMAEALWRVSGPNHDFGAAQ